jgi:germination protein M
LIGDEIVLKMIWLRVGFVTIVTLFLLLIMYIIPNENEYSLDLIKKQQLEYVNFNNNGEVIYLLDNNNYVAKTNIILSENIKTIEAKANKLLNTLISGNKNETIIPNGFRAIIPANTKIKSLKYNDSLIEVDFSKELLNIKEEYEEKMVEAIVYTLTSIKGVNKVLIKVDGTPLRKLPKTNVLLLDVLDKNFGINKLYDLNSSDNITSVTVYYLNKYNNNSYYIPITKYLNETKDKIKIIIDELSGSPIYQTNLMSFLNTKAKLLNYEQKNNQLILNFNDYIFDDLKEKNILEEVSYSIAYSVFDNYNVDSVVFSVNNEIIKTVSKNIE